MLRWIDNFPPGWLVIIAILLGLAPFTPEPHLWQKSRMLVDGSLTRPLDIFDLFMHGAPAILLIVKLARMAVKSK